jgi:hypothetical protein
LSIQYISGFFAKSSEEKLICNLQEHLCNERNDEEYSLGSRERIFVMVDANMLLGRRREFRM